MDFDAQITRRGLSFIAGDNEQTCRLCLDSTSKSVHLDDLVKLDKRFIITSMKVRDMFDELNVNIDPELPQVLCKSCVNSVINAYLFFKLVDYSNLKWNQVLDHFEKSLNLSDSITPGVQAAFLIITEGDSVICTTRKQQSATNKREAAVKLKTIIKSRDHYKKIKQTKSLKCIVCGVVFKSKSSLTEHMKEHSNNNKFPCRQCAKIFSSSAKLTDHAKRVHFPKRLQCPKCFKMFSTDTILKLHDRTHHTATICKLCFVQFPSKVSLRAHLDKHDVHKCPKCNKSFINRHTYKFHQKICGDKENRQLSFFCDICNKGYVRKNGLRTHIKTAHGFGQVLSCNWCAKKFDAISRLRNHIVKHTKERNFHCDICGGSFVTQAALVYHTRLHTGEKPFPCDMCDETFLSASRRMEHKRRKHLGPQKECRFCHSKFIRMTQLKRHIQRHYNPQSKLYIQDITQENNQYTTEDLITDAVTWS